MSRYPPCSNCHSTKFEEEAGIVTCAKCGLQQEGGLQVGDEEPEFGTQGKVVRKKIEKEKIKVTRVYKGARAYRLYLQAWQHILWRQAYVLTHGSARAPPELWTVARDLWTVRLSKLACRLQEDNSAANESEQDIKTTSPNEAEELEPVAIKTGLHPKLWDSVALIYVSAVLVRWPTTLRRIYELIRSEELPFIRAIRHVPVEMSSRLPPEYKHALDTLSIPTPRDLYQAVWRNLKLFSDDYGMSFPEINWRIILFDWIQHLALPIEIYATVKDLALLVECNFKYEVTTRPANADTEAVRSVHRKSPVAMAEVKLMCLMIVATKFLFPFTSDNAAEAAGHPNLRLDWREWVGIHELHKESLQHNISTTISPDRHIEMQDVDILSLSANELDSYMDWYQGSFTTPEAVLKTQKTTLEKSILDMFPLTEVETLGSMNNQGGNADKDQLIAQVQKKALKPVSSTEDKGKQRAGEQDSCEGNGHLRPGSRYPIFPTVESLTFAPAASAMSGEMWGESRAALYLHERAAELVCLDVNRLLKAIRRVERKLEKCFEQKKRQEAFDANEENNV